MSEPPRIRAVVFDLDGLMFNTEELYNHVGREILRRRGRVCTDDLLQRMMGRPGRVALQIMIDEHDLDDTVELLQIETEEIFDTLLDDRLRTMPGLLRLLGALETAELPKAIATSSSLSFTRRVLDPFDLEPRFAFVLTAADVVDGKPHPEIYQKAAQRFRVAAAEMLVLEDTQTGCRAASAAGAYTVAVPGAPSRGQDFSMAHLVAESLVDPRLWERIGLPPLASAIS